MQCRHGRHWTELIERYALAPVVGRLESQCCIGAAWPIQGALRQSQVQRGPYRLSLNARAHMHYNAVLPNKFSDNGNSMKIAVDVWNIKVLEFNCLEWWRTF